MAAFKLKKIFSVLSIHPELLCKAATDEAFHCFCKMVTSIWKLQQLPIQFRQQSNRTHNFQQQLQHQDVDKNRKHPHPQGTVPSHQHVQQIQMTKHIVISTVNSLHLQWKVI